MVLDQVPREQLPLRWLTYEGNDAQFFKWLENNKNDERVESVRWTPHQAIQVDASKSHLRSLTVHFNHPLSIVVPEHPYGNVTFDGDLSLLDVSVAPHAHIPDIHFHPQTSPDSKMPALALPEFPTLQEITLLGVYNSPLC